MVTVRSPWEVAADELDPPCDEWTEWIEHWVHKMARPTQLRPALDDWLVWLILAGRGFGKTLTGAETLACWAKEGPGHRFAIVGQTFGDARDTMVEGKSGVLSVLPPSALRGGSRESAWNRSLGELFFSNGARAKIFSSEKPGQLRGPEHDKAWVDEPAKFKDAVKGDALDTTWNNLMLGLRSTSTKPQVVVTGTPTACALIRHLLKRPHTVIVRGSTYDNLDNLAESFRDEVLTAYEGTRIGRQELLGEVLDDVEGSLWTLAAVDASRVTAAPSDLVRVTVAIDPAGGSTEQNDETGIVVTAKASDGHGYVLADRSGRYTPNAWARRAMVAYDEFAADRIVAETNFGGDMVVDTLRTAGFKGKVVKVAASRGKRQRAEPVASLYEQGRIHHVGAYPKLEDQMVTWLPESGGSPDRMDALVWGLSDLFLGTALGAAWAQAWGTMADAEPEQGVAVEDAEATVDPPVVPASPVLPRDTLGPLAGLQRRR